MFLQKIFGPSFTEFLRKWETVLICLAYVTTCILKEITKQISVSGICFVFDSDRRLSHFISGVRFQQLLMYYFPDILMSSSFDGACYLNPLFTTRQVGFKMYFI